MIRKIFVGLTGLLILSACQNSYNRTEASTDFSTTVSTSEIMSTDQTQGTTEHTIEEERPAEMLKIAGVTYQVEYADTITAEEFKARLPQEITMADLNANEKFYYLAEPLPTAPEKVGHINRGDLLLYGDNCVVLFYESFTTSYSYTRIGRLLEAESLADLKNTADVSVTLS